MARSELTQGTGKRGPRGSGTVRERKPGYWEVRVPARNGEGKPTQISRYVKGTRKDAEKLRRRLLAEVDSGHHQHGRKTVADLFEAWLKLVETQRAPLTVKAYRGNVRNHILPALGHLPLERLGPADLDKLYIDLRAKLAPNTIHLVSAIVGRALNQGVKWGWLVTNPADRSSPPPKQETEMTPPTWQQIAELIQSTERYDPTMALLIFVAALTGMRRGELSALRWSDAGAGRLTVSRGAISLAGVGTVVSTAKTRRSVRTIGIAEHLDAALRAHRARMEARAAALGTALSPDAYVFSNSAACSVPISPDEIGRRYREARAKVGHTYRLHDLRHFMGSWLMGRGVDVKTVSGRLGHASAKMTLDVYGHFSQALDTAAAAYTGELVLPATDEGEQP
jgi:integrase